MNHDIELTAYALGEAAQLPVDAQGLEFVRETQALMDDLAGALARPESRLLRCHHEQIEGAIRAQRPLRLFRHTVLAAAACVIVTVSLWKLMPGRMTNPQPAVTVQRIVPMRQAADPWRLTLETPSLTPDIFPPAPLGSLAAQILPELASASDSHRLSNADAAPFSLSLNP
jgi:hypothetical protein